MFEKYYTPEQLAELAERKRQLGEDTIRQTEQEWPALMAQVRAEMERGTSPADPKVQTLARRWQALVAAFTGGNPEIAKSLKTMYQNESVVHGMDTGPMREMAEYVGKALAAAG